MNKDEVVIKKILDHIKENINKLELDDLEKGLKKEKITLTFETRYLMNRVLAMISKDSNKEKIIISLIDEVNDLNQKIEAYEKECEDILKNKKYM